jgi:hypothetical protein
MQRAMMASTMRWKYRGLPWVKHWVQLRVTATDSSSRACSMAYSFSSCPPQPKTHHQCWGTLTTTALRCWSSSMVESMSITSRASARRFFMTRKRGDSSPAQRGSPMGAISAHQGGSTPAEWYRRRRLPGGREGIARTTRCPSWRTTG